MQDRNIILLHPGPVNRNVDISDEMLKDQDQSITTSYKWCYIRAAVFKN